MAKPKVKKEYDMLRASYVLLTAVLESRPHLVEELRAEYPKEFEKAHIE
jgi:hypothetical protein